MVSAKRVLSQRSGSLPMSSTASQAWSASALPDCAKLKRMDAFASPTSAGGRLPLPASENAWIVLRLTASRPLVKRNGMSTPASTTGSDDTEASRSMPSPAMANAATSNPSGRPPLDSLS
jgi:hypothetical protein